MMRKVLFIAPASFPANSAEAIVNLKQLKLLTDNGYQIDVISKRMKWTQYPEEQYDESLIKLNSLHIIEIDNKITFKVVLLHIMAFFTFGLVYKGAHWAYLGLNICKKLVKDNKYDYVITKNYPSELVGYYLKKTYNIPWVATWNDPFPHEKYPEPYGNGPNSILPILKRKLLSIMEKDVDIHLFPSLRLKNYMQQYLKIDDNKIAIVPHVVTYNSNLEEYLYSNRLEVVHTGNLQYPRNPKLFLEALHLFLNDMPTAQIRFTFIGVVDTDFKELINSYNLNKYINLVEPLTYRESLNILQQFNIAMIIEAPCTEGIFLPTKVSDYMQCGKDIFSISPSEGVLHDLYLEKSVRYFAVCNDMLSIKIAIEHMYRDFTSRISNDLNVRKKEFQEDAILETFNRLF